MSINNWTPEQQNKINEAIATKTEISRLAHKLIPKYELSPNDRSVPRYRINDKGIIVQSTRNRHTGIKIIQSFE